MLLRKLPDELIIQVSNHLKLAKDLSNLVLCGRRYHRLAIHGLYCTFDDNGNPLKLSQFLSTIMARPNLAPYVKTFISSGPHEHMSQGETALLRTDHMGPRLKAILAEVWPDQDLRDIWYEKLCGSEYGDAWEAIVALFMLLLPNLSTLSIPAYLDMRWKQEPRFIVHVVSRAIRLQDTNTPSPYSLKHLRNVEVVLLTDEERIPITSRAFLPLRSIRRLTSENNFRNNDADIVPFLKVIPNVTHFTLKNSDMSSPIVFATLLKPFCNLTHLTFTKCGQSEPAFAFYPDKMRLGVMHLTPSLQELIFINHQEELETVEYFVGENEGLPFGPLVEFQKLRRLEATVSTLVGRRQDNSNAASNLLEDFREGEDTRFAASLPDSLEKLVLRACFPNVFMVVEALFERRRQGALKGMKTVVLIFADGVDLDKLEEEGASCANEGQSLGILICIREGEDPWADHRNNPSY